MLSFERKNFVELQSNLPQDEDLNDIFNQLRKLNSLSATYDLKRLNSPILGRSGILKNFFVPPILFFLPVLVKCYGFLFIDRKDTDDLVEQKYLF